ncbi:antitoxin [Streptomyces sp. CC210A]|uniref:FitA-like ribbon-helix-helix domain-containing protein n=1 Tax=Streptomyces sp. CC210A TaxID=2898184 RepID=UPI001F3EFE7B|nr:antitoxin [Streptomyces sp. CC210A]
MPVSFTVRDVPDHIARAIEARAAEAGQSVQDYLLRLLIRAATAPSPAETTARAEHLAGGDADARNPARRRPLDR